MNTEWLAAMRRGDFATAWMISDAVSARRDPTERDDPRLPYHLRWVWDGRDFRGRDVLVRCYHGLGDTIQFARYLPVLRASVASLTLEVQPPLLPLLAGMRCAADRVVPFALEAPLPPRECDLEIMELAYALRLPPQEAPRPPYLGVTPLPLPSGCVGVAWQTGDWDPERAIPECLMRQFLRAQGALGTVFTVQPRPTTLPVVNPEGAPVDLVQTASLIAGLDLLITVDTLFAHLAGALNRPTWLLLKYDADWRWMQDRSDSPWYPSMRLFRQPSPGDWDAVIAEVARHLKAAD